MYLSHSLSSLVCLFGSVWSVQCSSFKSGKASTTPNQRHFVIGLQSLATSHLVATYIILHFKALLQSFFLQKLRRHIYYLSTISSHQLLGKGKKARQFAQDNDVLNRRPCRSESLCVTRRALSFLSIINFCFQQSELQFLLICVVIKV